MLLRDAQKGRPARPQRVKGRGVPGGYVEGLSEARTLLANFFSIPLVLGRDGGNASHPASFFARICCVAGEAF